MKRVFWGLGIFVIFGLFVFGSRINDVRLLYRYGNIFKPEQIFQSYRNMHNIYTNLRISAPEKYVVIPKSRSNHSIFPEEFIYDRTHYDPLQEIIDRDFTSLVIIKNDSIIYENYFNGNKSTDEVAIFGCTKSIISLLTGIAFHKGYIDDMDDVASKYAPDLEGTVYENVTIRNLINMSSGVKWNDDFSNLQSELVQSVLFSLKGSLNDYTKEMVREREQGTYHQVASMDIQVLAMVLNGATKKNILQFMKDELWDKIGAKGNASCMLDKAGDPIAYGGLIMSALDHAKIGLLMLHDGTSYDSTQLVSKEWIDETEFTDEKHLVEGRNNIYSESNFGYKYGWWYPEERYGNDYFSLGVYGQTLYVNPEINLVIACSSAYRDFKEDYYHADPRRIAMFQAIAKHIGETQPVQ